MVIVNNDEQAINNLHEKFKLFLNKYLNINIILI